VTGGALAWVIASAAIATGMAQVENRDSPAEAKMTESNRRGGPSIALLVSGDRELRDMLRRALAVHRLDLVHASSGVAGLELLQRFAGTFRLAVIDADVPGLPAGVLMATLRLFRPEVPLVCLRGRRALAGALETRCLGRPFDEHGLAERIDAALTPHAEPDDWALASDAVARARERFQTTGDLTEAARELARGMPPEPGDEEGW
jgi:DNA-binding response OmpR family regulator